MSIINSKINDILDDIEKAENYTVNTKSILKNRDKKEHFGLILFLIEYGALKELKSGTLVVLTKLGYEIQVKGGWIKYQRRIKIMSMIPIIKDFSLILIPILSIITTMYVATNNRDREINKQLDNYYTKLDSISEDLDQLKQVNLNSIELIDSLNTKYKKDTSK